MRARASSLALGLALTLSWSALAQEVAVDPADVGVDPVVDEEESTSADAPRLDPRLPPEPVEDPYSDERGALDPADEAALPSGEAIEHDPQLAGEAAVPPFSAVVDCPAGTTERRTFGDEGPELWCADGRGRRHGPFVRLYPSGSPRLRGSYLDGRRHGLFLAWFPSGRLEGKSSFERGLEHGVEQLFYESGRLRSTTTFHEGQKHGPHRAWHENGKLAASGSFEHGEAMAGWAVYDEEGRAIDPSQLAPEDGGAGGAVTGGADEELGIPPSKLLGATAGAIGATAGIAIGVPASLALIRLRALHVIDPQGWLVFLLGPPTFAAAGAALGTALLTRFPGPVMAAAGAFAGVPLGAALGGLVGGALAGVGALGAFALGATSDAAFEVLLVGAGLGAAIGAGVGPGALAAVSGWLYADGSNGAE